MPSKKELRAQIEELRTEVERWRVLVVALQATRQLPPQEPFYPYDEPIRPLIPTYTGDSTGDPLPPYWARVVC